MIINESITKTDGKIYKRLDQAYADAQDHGTTVLDWDQEAGGYRVIFADDIDSDSDKPYRKNNKLSISTNNVSNLLGKKSSQGSILKNKKYTGSAYAIFTNNDQLYSRQGISRDGANGAVFYSSHDEAKKSVDRRATQGVIHKVKFINGIYKGIDKE